MLYLFFYSNLGHANYSDVSKMPKIRLKPKKEASKGIEKPAKKKEFGGVSLIWLKSIKNKFDCEWLNIKF